MSTADDLLAGVRLIGGKELKATEIPGVFYLVRPWIPWKMNKTEGAKRDILRLFVRATPSCALRYGEDDPGLAESLSRALPSEVTRPAPGWCMFRSRYLEELLDSLDLGSWALYFAKSAALKPIGSEPMAFDPPGALRQTRRVGANIGIMSSHDDYEWLICILDVSGQQPP